MFRELNINHVNLDVSSDFEGASTFSSILLEISIKINEFCWFTQVLP